MVRGMTVELLAIMAHPDDAELLVGGTLAKAVALGHSVGILDLTGGERGSFGDVGTRAKEAANAARVMGASRHNAGLPDGALENSPAARATVSEIIRSLTPSTVILHWPDARHPDHRIAAELGRDASFLAGVGGKHRPAKVLYSLTYQEAHVKPTFVVDISDHFETKLNAIFAFESQFGGGKTSMGDVLGGDRPLRDQITHHHAHYGALIRRPFGEPFWTKETMLVEDVVGLAVRSL